MKENNTKEALIKELNTKKKTVEQQLLLQDKKKDILLQYCNLIINVIYITKEVKNNWDDILIKIKKAIADLSLNINQLSSLKEKTNKMLQDTVAIKSDDEDEVNSLYLKLDEYNQEEEKIIDNILDKNIKDENTIYNIIKKANELLTKHNETVNKIVNNNEKQEKTIEKENKVSSEENICDNKMQDNRVLIISEADKKVYLPYYYKDIINIMKNTKEKNPESIIKEKYIIDISKFKNSITARFKEAYNLIRNKENGSIVKAINLGMELMLNYSLNPAVIAACENEDELDIYLDCLEENELDQFKIFDIKYITAPVVVKSKKNKHSFE